MEDVLSMLIRLIQDFEVIKAYILSLSKSKIDHFKETWIDGQAVLQTLGIGKRSLQTLRDNGILPYSRINGKFYYKVSDIVKLLEKNYSGSKSMKRGTK